MKVICITYNGSSINSNTVAAIIKCISGFVVDNSAVVNTYTEEDMSSLCIKDSVKKIDDSERISATESACIYISKRFGGLFDFPLKMIIAMAELKATGSNEEKAILHNAVKILSNPLINNALLDKYKISSKITTAIKEFNLTY